MTDLTYYENNRQKEIDYNHRYRKEHKKELMETKATRDFLWKLEALVQYSNSYPPKCQCCELEDIRFLSIDYINGGGNQHRKHLGGTGLYWWLKKYNYPKGFRVLCFNCNLAKGFYGDCHD